MNSLSQKGITLVEVLISFAILLTTGMLLSGFLFRGPVTQMARNENYGNELSKIILLTKTMENQSDSIYQHTDINGNHWEILLSQSTDGNETCFNATAIRNKTDSTQSLYFCKYHSNLEVRNE